MIKIAYFWTWDFSANILEDLIDSKKIDIKLVVSQPDKAVWRKKIITKTPVKILAEANNIEVSQAEKLRNNLDFFDKLNSLDLDFIVVVAYWKIIPKEVLEANKYWAINIHWSLLPKYRWASPIQEAIKNWDKKTGLTIMYMNEKMDEWDILSIEEFNIDIIDKSSDIFEKFEKKWAKLLINTLKKIISWKLKWQKQNENLATYCSKIEKSDWKINFWEETAKEIYDKSRAYNPWPGIFSFYNNKKFEITDCFFEEIDLDEEWFRVWDVVELETENSKNKEIWIICKTWILTLKKVKLEWKKETDIISFINWNKKFLDFSFS